MDRAEPVKKSRGRPSSFVREDMVDTIMNLFWEHGYAGLSFNEIAKATGLTRASLYNAFESKEALLLEVLDHYFADAPDAVLNTVRPGDPVGPALQKMLIMASELRGADDKQFRARRHRCLFRQRGKTAANAYAWTSRTGALRATLCGDAPRRSGRCALRCGKALCQYRDRFLGLVLCG